MTKRLLLILLAVVFTASIINAEGEEKYGKDLTLKEQTKIVKILHHSKEYEGKTVQITGKIVKVCEHAGCWIDVQGDKEDQIIKVKVDDGVIVFPKDAIGKTVVAEGVVYKVEANDEEEMEHEASESAGTLNVEMEKVVKKEVIKKDTDKKEIVTTTEEEHSHAEGETCSPAGNYQIKGTGAIIK
ncbi:MAG: DUF4920 domain-containing protein [Melioribacteraceae bacterium]|nr:DUF4920 domain-containing protein [Melioribacteraceae bacterium]